MYIQTGESMVRVNMNGLDTTAIICTFYSIKIHLLLSTEAQPGDSVFYLQHMFMQSIFITTYHKYLFYETNKHSNIRLFAH